jgi:2',3'-cyclic-nucleotide 2'-phosphodiesterase (5'-nucleotidase family)
LPFTARGDLRDHRAVPTSTATAPRGPVLRLVCINDVYTLENLPRLRTLAQRMRDDTQADLVLTTMAGDFVGPSLLSSLDLGRGMIDCMNAVPITHAVLGNHEDDIGAAELCARLHELRATVLSTNVIGLDPSLPTAQIVEVSGPGTRRVRVGLVGVVMDDAGIYRKRPFGGATLLPANETARRAARHLVSEEGCACVVPLTHQTMEADRALAEGARACGIPVIVGGHEHTAFLEQIAGTWVVKAGCDATHAVIVDLAWPAEAPPAGSPDLPEVRVRLESVAPYPEDPALRARVDGHLRALAALQSATLFSVGHAPERAAALHLGPGAPLSSVGTRARQTSLGTLLCSLLRDALEADACVMNGGGIRAAREYPTHFTYGDLEAEVPFDNEIVVVTMPGRVLAEAVAASRAHAPVESGGFLQVDDRMRIEPGTTQVVAVAGAPIDPARAYRVALVRDLFEGMDHIEPLVRFAREEPARIPPALSGRDVKHVLVEAFSRALWEQLGSFDAIDANHDGVVDAREIADAVARFTAEPASPITVDLLLKAIDADHDRLVSRAEAEAVKRRDGAG